MLKAVVAVLPKGVRHVACLFMECSGVYFCLKIVLIIVTSLLQNCIHIMYVCFCSKNKSGQIMCSTNSAVVFVKRCVMYREAFKDGVCL